jgi:hypothetical protein
MQNLADSLDAGRLDKRQISLRELAESYLGPMWQHKLADYNSRKGANWQIRESSDAVDASQFADITGQLLINEIRQGYTQGDDVTDELVDVVPITNGNLGTQKTPWLSELVNDAETIQPGMPYPSNTFGEQYIVYPAPEKFGTKLLVTMEAIYSDLTAQMMRASDKAGRRVRINKAERILRVVLGLVNTHAWNGTNYSTYLSSGNWVNIQSGLTITDWTHINKLDVLFYNMTDPVSGKPIMIKPDYLLCMPTKYPTHKRIQTATTVRSGVADTSNVAQMTYAPTPLELDYKLLKSQLAYNLLQTTQPDLTVSGGTQSAGTFTALAAADAAEVVIYGSKEAFVWRQAEPFTAQQAPAGNWLDFNNDIALAIKCREWGVAGVRDPRYAIRAYNTGTLP